MQVKKYTEEQRVAFIALIDWGGSVRAAALVVVDRGPRFPPVLASLLAEGDSPTVGPTDLPALRAHIVSPFMCLIREQTVSELRVVLVSIE